MSKTLAGEENGRNKCVDRKDGQERGYNGK